MGKRANILTWSTLSHNKMRTQEELLSLLEQQLAESEKMNPDLICFSEEVLLSGGDGKNPAWVQNNEIALSMMKEGAKRMHTNIIICLEEPSNKYLGRSYNTTYIIDRQGNIIDKYRKRHITFRAIADRGLTGERLVVCDTDIGRIGIMTCFDIGWREDWLKLAEMGAELVVWNSAYDGGFLLNAYAAVGMYHVVSSVWGSARSRIIDPFGQDMVVSSRWDGLSCATVDLGMEIFHIDHHLKKISELRRYFGDRIVIQVKSEDNMFSLSSLDPNWPIERIRKEFQLQTYREYHEQSTRDNINMLQKYPEDLEDWSIMDF